MLTVTLPDTLGEEDAVAGALELGVTVTERVITADGDTVPDSVGLVVVLEDVEREAGPVTVPEADTDVDGLAE